MRVLGLGFDHPAKLVLDISYNLGFGIVGLYKGFICG